ncbi:unnamed protein product [Vitrella brassicaformis CCMP3155]|uniref:Uncharacterized protein n=1 Tax=Vitrella brassicaformis (strain CCMP3155) TaxID=1169540 RepID=A0A0G4ENA5_VITBC|nr:unnamed protein product [Vitrella brassicaformis CCMP3155]|eukprot:CEL98477.1 unnamed protein product [Vitrella brassicaformis CCMP3155]
MELRDLQPVVQNRTTLKRLKGPKVTGLRYWGVFPETQAASTSCKLEELTAEIDIKEVTFCCIKELHSIRQYWLAPGAREDYTTTRSFSFPMRKLFNFSASDLWDRATTVKLLASLATEASIPSGLDPFPSPTYSYSSALTLSTVVSGLTFPRVTRLSVDRTREGWSPLPDALLESFRGSLFPRVTCLDLSQAQRAGGTIMIGQGVVQVAFSRLPKLQTVTFLPERGDQEGADEMQTEGRVVDRISQVSLRVADVPLEHYAEQAYVHELAPVCLSALDAFPRLPSLVLECRVEERLDHIYTDDECATELSDSDASMPSCASSSGHHPDDLDDEMEDAGDGMHPDSDAARAHMTAFIEEEIANRHVWAAERQRFDREAVWRERRRARQEREMRQAHTWADPPPLDHVIESVWVTYGEERGQFYALLRNRGYEMVELSQLEFDYRLEIRPVGVHVPPRQRRITDYFRPE